MKFLFTGSLLVLLLLCGLIPPARAQIQGTISGAGTLTLDPTTGLVHQVFDSIGDDTLFGPFTGHSTADRDVTDPLNPIILNGMFTETFADGMLFGTFTGKAVSTGPNTSTFENNLIFTGGTGIFSGAFGTALVTGTALRTGPTTFTADAVYRGFLTMVPEPGVKSLLAASGMSFGGLLALRRRVR